jgi:hypothetical protein
VDKKKRKKNSSRQCTLSHLNVKSQREKRGEVKREERGREKI